MGHTLLGQPEHLSKICEGQNIFVIMLVNLNNRDLPQVRNLFKDKHHAGNRRDTVNPGYSGKHRKSRAFKGKTTRLHKLF